MKIATAAAGISERYGKLLKRSTMFNLDKLNELKSSSWECDINPLIEDLGFTPEYSLEEGVSKTIKWNIENKIL